MFSSTKISFWQDLPVLNFNKHLRSFVITNSNESTTIILNFTCGVGPELNSIFIIICVHYVACASRIFVEVKQKLIRKSEKKEAKTSKD